MELFSEVIVCVCLCMMDIWDSNVRREGWKWRKEGSKVRCQMIHSFLQKSEECQTREKSASDNPSCDKQLVWTLCNPMRAGLTRFSLRVHINSFGDEDPFRYIKRNIFALGLQYSQKVCVATSISTLFTLHIKNTSSSSNEIHTHVYSAKLWVKLWLIQGQRTL